MKTEAVVFLVVAMTACEPPPPTLPSCRASHWDAQIGSYDPTSAPCFPAHVNRDPAGLLKCRVEATLAVGLDCTDLGEALASDDGVDATGRARCVLRQAPVTAATRASGAAPTEPGVFFDDYTAAALAACGGGQQLALTRPIDLRDATVAIACARWAVPTDEDGTGSPCMPPASPCPASWICEPTSLSCQRPCTTDTDCAPGLVCNTANPVPYCDDPRC